MDKVINHCNALIASSDQQTLQPFEPDIMGETFFLLILQHFKDKRQTRHKTQKIFFQMLEVEEDKTPSESAFNFISFVQRLADNLLNDNQKDYEILNFWKSLVSFLNPDNFSQDSNMYWSVSVAASGIIRCAIRSELKTDEINQLINQVRLEDLYNCTEYYLLEKSLINVMLYYHYFLPEQSQKSFHSLNLLRLIEMYDSYIIKNGGKTALMQAALYKYERVISLLLSQNRVNEKYINRIEDEEGFSAFLYAVLNGCTLETIKALCDKGADIHYKNPQGITSLIATTYNTNIQVVDFLINKNVEIDARVTVNENNVLHYGAIFGQTDLVTLLLQKTNIDKESTNHDGCTAIGLAVLHKHFDTAEKLIKADVNFDHQDKHGMTPLLYAINNNDTSITELLIKHKADINIPNNKGETVLIGAILNDNRSLIKDLLERGINVDLYDDNGRPPLIYAAITGYYEVIPKLITKKYMLIFVILKAKPHWHGLVYKARKKQSVRL